MAGACCLAVECDETRIDFRLRTRYVDAKAETLDEALAMIEDWTREGRGEIGRPARQRRRVFPELVRRSGGRRPDIVTDQTSAHDPLHGYLPHGLDGGRMAGRAGDRARQVVEGRPARRCACMSRRWSISGTRGVPTLDYGNNIRQVAKDEGLENAFAFPGFVPAYIRPLFCRGIGPFRWVALSGDPEDIRKTDAAMKQLFPDNAHLHRWLDMARSGSRFRACRRASAGSAWAIATALALMFNEMVETGELKAPDRDRARPPRFRLGRLARTARPKAMKDGSDAVSDWPLLNALLNTAGGRDLGVAAPRRRRWHGLLAACRRGDRGRRQRAAAKRLERVLWNDPAPASCGMPMRAMKSR